MTELADLVALLDELGPALLSTDEDTGLRSLCEAARLATGAAACSIAALDEIHGELTYLAAAGAGASDIEGHRLPLGQGIAGFVASAGQALTIADVRADPRFAHDVAETTGYVPTAMVVVPIRFGEDVVGILSVLDTNAANLALVTAFASAAAPSLHRGAAGAALGRVILSAMAQQATDTGVADALRDAAETSTGPSPDLAELAALYAELAGLGADDRAVATRIVAQFTAHAAGSQQRRTVRHGRR